MSAAPAAPRPGKLLLRRPQDDSAARLFCFPYSGLGASMFGRWPRFLGDIEVCLIQPPGRENRMRDPHFGTYEELAGQVADGIEPLLDRPFGLFGHCGGALAAFATALLLSQRSLPAPRCLFISSQVAPHEGPFGRFLSMSDDELSVELAGLTRAMGAEPQPEILALSLRILRADVTANQHYRLDDPVVLPGGLCSIGWADDSEIRPGQMSGWSAYATPDRFTHTVLPGAHHEFLGAPDVLRAELTRGLAAATTEVRR